LIVNGVRSILVSFLYVCFFFLGSFHSYYVRLIITQARLFLFTVQQTIVHSKHVSFPCSSKKHLCSELLQGFLEAKKPTPLD